MFARHVGTKSAILLERGAEIVFLSSSRPHKLHGRQGSYLDRFHEVCPLWTLSTVSSAAGYGACTSTTHHDTRALSRPGLQVVRQEPWARGMFV